MPIDPSILLQSRQIDASAPAREFQNTLLNMGALSAQKQSLANSQAQAGRNAEMQPLLLRQKAQQIEQSNQLNKMKEFELKKIVGGDLHAFYTSLKNTPAAQRESVIRIASPWLSGLGKTPDDIGNPNNWNDEAIDSQLTALAPFDPSMQSGGGFQKGQGTLVEKDGVQYFSTPILNPNTGEMAATLTPVGGDVLSRRGETAAAETDRRIQEAGGVQKAKLEEDLRVKPSIKKQEELAKDAAKLSTEIFTRIGGIESNISNMKEGIRLVDEGAATGPINKWLPSFRESTVKLNNLKNRLGLDVISQVTFGALSEKELETAFDTAMPSNLKGEALKGWFQERITLQETLLSKLEGAGIFLAEDGASIPKLMAKNREERKAEPKAEPTATNRLEELRAKAGI